MNSRKLTMRAALPFSSSPSCSTWSRLGLSLGTLSAALALASPALAAGSTTHAGAHHGKAAHADSHQAADRAFDRLAHQFIEALWKLDADAALVAGRYDGAARLPAPDAAGRQKALAFAQLWQARFAAVKPEQLSDRARTDLALLQNKVASDAWYLQTLREFAWNPSSYNVAGAMDLILNTDYAPRPQRLKALLARLKAVPAYYEAAYASIETPTREHTQLAVSQIDGTLAVFDEIEKAAKEEHKLAAADRKSLAPALAAARSAVKAYQQRLQALDEKLTAKGQARSFRLGRELYERKFQLDIQSASSAEQTYQKALSTREQLLAKMDELADQLWTKTQGEAPKPADRIEKIDRVIKALSVNHVKAENFLAEIRQQIPQLQAFVQQKDLLTVDPKKPLQVRETPAYQRGVAGASIEAPGPYRPQDRTYYNVTPLDDLKPEQAESTLREYNHWILQILNIHEAIPGHYTQLVHANKSPSLVKALFGNGAMIEGWAVYGERMMLEAGYGEHAPEMWLMYCKWNLRSVTNTILDYSVHVLGMTQDEALALLTQRAFQTEQEAREKWRRVQLTSVQLTSYFSGYSEIMALREERKKALGDRFDLKAFHDQFLSYGSAPVAVIRELMR
ncbi:DUF885 domain-containing protein [Roseateles sp. DB2]|uniref:DUF885 domain-containing protein n=1 Tax=Roseateles sp. DB2 TaxID=3453717 RepID=UPI003F6ED3D7